MASKPQRIPDGFHGATPYLCCRDAARAVEFYRRAFGAIETLRLAEPDGRIGHAEIKIGDAVIMLSDEYPDFDAVSPQALGGTPVAIHVYVADIDVLVRQAAAAGATVQRGPEDEFYGDRAATLTDPFGHRWKFATHIEDVSGEEMQKRYDKLMNAH